MHVSFKDILFRAVALRLLMSLGSSRARNLILEHLSFSKITILLYQQFGFP